MSPSRGNSQTAERVPQAERFRSVSYLVGRPTRTPRPASPSSVSSMFGVSHVGDGDCPMRRTRADVRSLRIVARHAFDELHLDQSLALIGAGVGQRPIRVGSESVD